MAVYDVYSYGVIAASTLHLLSKPFPAPDAYAEIAETYSMTGGEAANSSIVLSRLGKSVLLDGNWIGDTPEGHALLGILRRFDIDISRLTVQAGYGGVKEIVFSDQHTRTIFGNYEDLLFTTRKWNIPRKEDIAQARIICLDPPFKSESAQVARYAVELGVPYVTIDCSYEDELAQQAAALIISGEFRDREYPAADLDELFDQYQAHAAGLVVLTNGGDQLLYGRPGQPVQRLAPYPIKVIDSAGAGDSFRAGLVYGLLEGWTDRAALRYASALAAMICASFPGVLNCPRHAEVMDFITEREI
jgi:sugar/nucleoside kinase (ribokinase family)